MFVQWSLETENCKHSIQNHLGNCSKSTTIQSSNWLLWSLYWRKVQDHVWTRRSFLEPEVRIFLSLLSQTTSTTPKFQSFKTSKSSTITFKFTSPLQQNLQQKFSTHLQQKIFQHIYNKNFLTNLQTNFSTHNSQINFSIYLFMYVCICKHVHHYVENGRDKHIFVLVLSWKVILCSWALFYLSNMWNSSRN